MTKPQLIETIDSLLNNVENECSQDLLSSQRNGIDEKYEVGEYAFFESEYQEDYDFFISDMKSGITYECGYTGDIEFCQWSSKSGTSVFMDAFMHDDQQTIWDFENEWGYTHNDTEVDEFTYIELMDILKDARALNKEVTKDRKQYDEWVEGATKIVSSMAEGTCVGSFSNGEAIFEPTNPEQETFYGRYNPNEESA